MYVKVSNNRIDVGPQSRKGDGPNWYRYEGVSPLDAGLDDIISVSVSGSVATGSFIKDPSLTGAGEDFNRITRNELLAASDYTQLPDSPFSTAKKAEWATYRQSLRDLDMTTDPNQMVWPAEPS